MVVDNNEQNVQQGSQEAQQEPVVENNGFNGFNFPEDIKEEEKTQFIESFKKYAGIEEEQLRNTFATAQELPTYQQRLQELESSKGTLQSELQRYKGVEDPISKKAIDMLAEGASQSDVQDFFRIQSLDVAGMSNKEVLIEDYMSQGLDREMANVLASDELDATLDEDGEVDKVRTAKLELKVKQLKNSLNEKKVASSNPQILANKEEQRRSMENFINSHRTVAPQVQAKLSKLSFETKHGEDQFKLDYEVPAEIVSQLDSTMIEFAKAHNLQPGDPAIEDHARRTIMYANGPQIIEDITAKIYEQVVAKFSNAQPPQGGENRPPAPKSQGKEDLEAFRAWKKKNVKTGGM